VDSVDSRDRFHHRTQFDTAVAGVPLDEPAIRTAQRHLAMARAVLCARERDRSDARPDFGPVVASVRAESGSDPVRIAEAQIHRGGRQAGRLAGAGHLLDGNRAASRGTIATSDSPQARRSDEIGIGIRTNEHHERAMPDAYPQMPKICGDEMIWLPLKNVWSVVYRWRAWCREHGFAKRGVHSR
jgi:hypothetical protein